MKRWKHPPLTLALALAFPAAMAQSNAELLKALQDLQQRVTELEARLKASEAAQAAPAAAQWGMTPEQVQEFNRIAIKTEAMEDNVEMWGLKGLTISGYADPTYLYNRNQKRAGFQFLNPQSDGFFYDTSYIGSVAIDFTKETDSGTRWKLTLTPNRGVGEVIGAGIVQEATVSIPLTDLQTRLLVGQVPDWSGYEYQQPTLNPFITHNLLYDFTLPTAYTGVGIDYTKGKWWARAMLANVNEPNGKQGERQPALVYRLDYSKGEFNGWGLAGLHGRTTNFNLCRDGDCTEFFKTATHLFEVDGYFIRGDWTVQGQLSYGTQKQAGIVPNASGEFGKAEWWGLSGLAGYLITPRLQALVRADYIRNDKNGGGLLTYNGYWNGVEGGYGIDGPYGDYRNGIGPDPTLGCEDQTLEGCTKGADRYALSFGLKYAYNLNTTFKAEYRFDGSNLPVFAYVKDGSFRKHNHLFGAAVVMSF
ncbi:MAG TPA: DUF3138 family protein [Methylibium sp.]|nr:DUF3138 family protein [Methylibium sp.]